MKHCAYKKYIWNNLRDLVNIHDYVVLDLETTGLSPTDCNIIEVGMAKVTNDVYSDEFSSLVNPHNPLPKRITKITGITDDILIDAPSFSEIAERISVFIGDLPVIGHNISFDLSFLSHALDECGIAVNFTYIDTLAVARKAFPTFENHKLETLISELHLAENQTHRALDDVQCTLRLFQKVCDTYSSPLTDILLSCCRPIENCTLLPSDLPLEEKSLTLIGSFTFSYSSAQKLISAAGGTISKNITPDTDYLVYGFQDMQQENSEQYFRAIEYAKSLQNQGNNIELINEVKLLEICGVIFW